MDPHSCKVLGKQRIFIELYFLQDRALADLAIEDKKRQFDAAEKYFDDVLQSALAPCSMTASFFLQI